jgi:hypothetical protein
VGVGVGDGGGDGGLGFLWGAAPLSLDPSPLVGEREGGKGGDYFPLPLGRGIEGEGFFAPAIKKAPHQRGFLFYQRFFHMPSAPL